MRVAGDGDRQPRRRESALSIAHRRRDGEIWLKFVADLAPDMQRPCFHMRYDEVKARPGVGRVKNGRLAVQTDAARFRFGHRAWMLGPPWPIVLFAAGRCSIPTAGSYLESLFSLALHACVPGERGGKGEPGSEAAKGSCCAPAPEASTRSAARLQRETAEAVGGLQRAAQCAGPLAAQHHARPDTWLGNATN
jgi:hypothetical protein